MSTLFVGSTKGGTGKSTIATNLSVLLNQEGESLLIDTDLNRSASYWAGVRSESEVSPRVPCIQLYGKSVNHELPQLANKYDHIIVDGAGHDSAEFRSALIHSKIFLLVLKPSQFDVWSLDHLEPILDQVTSSFNPDLVTKIVLNQASTHPFDNMTEKALDVLMEYKNVSVCKSVIRHRKAFQSSIETGQGVSEGPDRKAKEEIMNLYKEIYETRE